MNLTHHAEYLTPGIFFPELDHRMLTERSVSEAMRNAPQSAYCFTLYDLPVSSDDAPEGFTLIPKRQNESGRFYIDAKIYTLAEIQDMGEEMRILASNMEGNRWSHVVKCRTGNWQPFESVDTVIASIQVAQPT